MATIAKNIYSTKIQEHDPKLELNINITAKCFLVLIKFLNIQLINVYKCSFLYILPKWNTDLTVQFYLESTSFDAKNYQNKN